MSDRERDELRKLQDRWLNLPVIRRHIANWGLDEPIAASYPGAFWPTFRQVRETLLPDLKAWFKDFFRRDAP